MLRTIEEWHEKYIVDDWIGPASARNFPTVKDVDEFCSSYNQDIIKQVTKGQGLYFGYECERFCDNNIPVIKTEFITNEYKSEQRTRYKQKKLESDLYKLIGISETEQLLKRLKYHATIKHNQKTL